MKTIFYILILIFTIQNAKELSLNDVSNIHFKQDKMNTTTKVQEIWKTIPNYPNYEVSNLGNVKSLDRLVNGRWGKAKLKGRLINQYTTKQGYKRMCLNSNHFSAHQLVTMAFLGHVPNRNNLVVNHINFNKADNRLENLEIVTNRENSNKKHLKSSSKYVGVSWFVRDRCWRARISINSNQIHLGFFKIEHDAHLAYQKALSNI